jgi:multidrug resistance efflux pump
MANSPSPLTTLRRQADRFGIRLLPLLMVLVCSALVIGLSRLRSGEVVASGIADGSSVALSTATTATITKVHVQVGEDVKAGQPLVSMSSLELSAELGEVEAQIRQVSHAGEVAQVELLRGLADDQRAEVLKLFEAERDALAARAEQELEHELAVTVTSSLSEAEQLAQAGMLEANAVRERVEAARFQTAQEKAASLVLRAKSEHVNALRKQIAKPVEYQRLLTATAELYKAELDVLIGQRDGLKAQLDALEIRAPYDGIVSELLPAGSVATAGLTVVRVVPPFARDVVAYVPPDSAPPVLAQETPYVVALADGRECSGMARARLTGSVERKPEQLVGPMGFSAFGFPVRIALGADCKLPIGQVVELRLSTP